MKFNIHITEDDFIYFNQFHLLNSKEGKSVITITSLVVPIVSILATIVMILLKVSRVLLFTEISVLLLVSILAFWGTKKFILKNMSRASVKLKRKGNLPYEEDSILEFTKDEIIEESQRGSFSLPYSSITFLYQSSSYLFLYFGKSSAIILPFRSLDDKLEEFKSFLEDKTGKTFTIKDIRI